MRPFLRKPSKARSENKLPSHCYGRVTRFPIILFAQLLRVCVRGGVHITLKAQRKATRRLVSVS